MSCKGILPQTRNGSGQIEDLLKKEPASPASYRKNAEVKLGDPRILLPENNQDVAEDGVNGENISSSVLEISSSNFTLPSSEITSDIGVSVDDWFKTRSDGMDLDSVLTTDGLGVSDLESYQFTPSKENVDMCVVTNICDIGLGFDLPVNICDKRNKILDECEREVNSVEYEGTFLDDFDNSIVDKNLLVKRTATKLNEDCKELNSNFILQTEDKAMKGVQNSAWSDNEDVFMEIEPVILTDDNANWESLSTGSQRTTDYESEKDDFPEFSLLTFQVDNAEGVNVINSLSQMDCISENSIVPANYIVSDDCIMPDAVSFSHVSESVPQNEGITRPRVIRGNKSAIKKKCESNSEVLVEECVVESLPFDKSNLNKKSAVDNGTSASNPRSLLRLTPKSTNLKPAIEPDSLVKKVSETCNLLPTPVKAEILETENGLRVGSSSKKAPAMTIIAISTDKLKNTTEIVINTSQGEQKFKGKTSDFIKATSKLISSQPLKARIGQSLNLSNVEVLQDELVVQQSENVPAEGWSKFDRSKAADEQPITEALAALGIDLSSLNYVTAGGNSGYKLWECPTQNCNKLYPRLSLLKVHILTHYGVRPYRCDIPGCQWTFYTCFKLKRHKETHLKKKAFICPVPSCGHRFTTIYNLKTHRKLHERPAKLQCPVVGCDAHFQTKRAVELHVKKHGISHAPYQCTFAGCGKRYYSSNTLNSHARSHQHREEEVRCQWPDCGKWFDKPCRLKAHMRTHTGDKPYLCTYENCGWAFSSASKLKRHQQKHTNERKFLCSFEGCGKSFMRSEHLKEHMQTHVGERSYQCTVENCGVKFTAKSSLYVHLKKHKLQTKDGKLAMESRTVSRFQTTNGASTSTSTAGATVNATGPSVQQQKKSNTNGVAKGLISNGPVQVVMPVTASSNSFHCPVDSCPKNYSCKASLRQHLLKHHTPVLASDANQLDYVTSLLLSGGSNQQVVISSSDNDIAEVQGSVCTVAVSGVENNNASGLLPSGTMYETGNSYPSEYISTDLLNSQLNNMLVVTTSQENSQDGENGHTVLLSADEVATDAALAEAEAELRLATESIKDPLLVEDYHTNHDVPFDIPELVSTQIKVPDDPTCRCARTNLTFQDIVQRKQPHVSANSAPPRKGIAGGTPTISHIDSSLTVEETLRLDGSDAATMAGTIAGLRDPVAALRLPPDMAGLLAPTADLNLLLQEDSGLQVLLLDGNEGQNYAEANINLRDLD